ncbi:MAG: flagellar basal body P-ring protein FlgI [Verrucomicrobiota bacterium]|nr:flagellar basal body P-ring protein FlgI [Verrucomicrobiota bacterium]
MRLLLFIGSFLAVLGSTLCTAARIKDLVLVEGGRDNQLVGYGLVVGLAGDGDSTSSIATLRSVANALQRFGMQVNQNEIKAANSAVVMVTADIGPYLKSGNKIDVTLASLGDAKSLQGGILLQTPLIGADGEVYAVAQGPVAIGGFLGGSAGPGGATVQKNHPTVGIISNGALVEKEIASTISKNGILQLLLREPDYTTAARLAESINVRFPGLASATDAGTITVTVPEEYSGKVVAFVSEVGALQATPDTVARIVLNERTGTIVANGNVRLSQAAISHGALTIRIASNLAASQPNPLASGQTVILPSTQTDVTEMRGGFKVVEEAPSVEELATALNALGVSTREMLAIFQTLKKAGALQAELIIE